MYVYIYIYIYMYEQTYTYTNVGHARRISLARERPGHILRIHRTKNPESGLSGNPIRSGENPTLTSKSLLESNHPKSRFSARGLVETTRNLGFSSFNIENLTQSKP